MQFMNGFSFVFLALLFAISSVSAFAITGGGNFTNFSNVTGGAINITGAGYYYYVRSSTAATPAAGHINYTGSTPTFPGQAEAISIETSNVVVDCQYPSLPRSMIFGPTSFPIDDGNSFIMVAAVTINGTRAGATLQNVTVRNCIFSNFSRYPGTGIRIVGSASDVLIYNNTVNSSGAGVTISTVGTGNVNSFSGQWSNINISTNTFYNSSYWAEHTLAAVIRMNSTPYPGEGPANPVSFVNCTIEHNNFTMVKDDFAIRVANASNLTVFNNTIYNSYRGMMFTGLNNSNLSNNNVTNTFGDSNTFGIASYAPVTQTPDLSSVPNTFAYNAFFNLTCCDTLSAGIFSNQRNSNITGNVVNRTYIGLYLDSLSSYNKVVSNLIDNASNVGLLVNTANYDVLVNNTITYSLNALVLQTGSNETSLIGNNITRNNSNGLSLNQAFNTTSQDDSITGNLGSSILFAGSGNLTAVNLSANLSNISYSAGTVGFTSKVPLSVFVKKSSDSTPLTSAVLYLISTGGLPAGVGGTLNITLVDSLGNMLFNATSYVAYNDVSSPGSLLSYNFTPHSIQALATGYTSATSLATLPAGTHAPMQIYNFSLVATVDAHAGGSGGSGGGGSSGGGSSGGSGSSTSNTSSNSTTLPVSSVNRSVSNNSAIASGSNFNSINSIARVNSTSNTAAVNDSCVSPCTGRFTLALPGVGNFDLFLFAAVLAVVVLFVLILFHSKFSLQK